MAVTNLNRIFELVKNKEKKRLVVSYGQDEHTIKAVNKGVDKGLIEATFVGDEKTITDICSKHEIDPNKFSIINEPDEIKAANTAAITVSEGKGDALMKGLVSTDKFMRSLLNKENGLIGKHDILTHVSVLQSPNYHKLLIVGDVAIIPEPDLKQKVAITNYLINTAHHLEIEKPKVAAIAATEQVLESLPASVDASLISKMGDRGQIKGAEIEGPLGLDLAISKEAAAIKNIKSEVAGNADCLLFPNLEAGNVFYKTNTKMLGASVGAMLVGAKVPAVLSSRGDSEEVKLNSIALAALMA